MKQDTFEFRIKHDTKTIIWLNEKVDETSDHHCVHCAMAHAHNLMIADHRIAEIRFNRIGSRQGFYASRSQI